VAKRLMMSHAQLIVAGNPTASLENLNVTIFQKSFQANPFEKWKVPFQFSFRTSQISLTLTATILHSHPALAQSLFPGLGFGAGYKILQRVYKFGGQPYVK
jgi:ABC-type sugar transport system substrate-binding protein